MGTMRGRKQDMSKALLTSASKLDRHMSSERYSRRRDTSRLENILMQATLEQPQIDVLASSPKVQPGSPRSRPVPCSPRLGARTRASRARQLTTQMDEEFELEASQYE